MELQAKFIFREGYLPTKRHRILRYRDTESQTTVTLNEITINEAPVAFLTHEALQDNPTEYRWWNNKLWVKLHSSSIRTGAKGLYPVKEFIESFNSPFRYTDCESEESAIKKVHEYVSQHLIIDDVLYTKATEPRYVVMTFGLGHNHGGTSLFIEGYYNSNISKSCYFNALERDNAIASAKDTASRRGDTESIDRIGKTCNIEVFITEAVNCNPQKEHGDGDPFINQLNSITESSPSVSASAMLALGVLAKEMNK